MTPFLWLCLMGGLAIFSSTMSKNPALPLFAQHLGATEADIGFIAAASTVVGIATSVPAGVLSDLYGRKRAILASTFVFASAPFLYLLVRSAWQLALVRVYHGLATAILGPVALAAVADAFQARRGESMAWYSSATLIGRLLAPTVGGFLILSPNNFNFVYLACGMAGLTALAIAARTPLASGGTSHRTGRRGLGAAGRQLARGLGQVVVSRDILITGLMEAVQYLAYGCVEVYLPLYALQIGLAPWQIGPLLTTQVAITALAKPLMGRLSDRWGRRLPIAGGLVLGALALAAMPQARIYLLLMALAALFGLGVAMVTSSTSPLASELCQTRAYGSAMGVLSSIKDVGHASGPVVAGLLATAFGYPFAFAAVAAALVSAAIVFLLSVAEPRRARP